MRSTLAEAVQAVKEMAGKPAQADAVGTVMQVNDVGVQRVVADKSYQSKESVRDLSQVGVRTVIAEPERKGQQWTGHLRMPPPVRFWQSVEAARNGQPLSHRF